MYVSGLTALLIRRSLARAQVGEPENTRAAQWAALSFVRARLHHAGSRRTDGQDACIVPFALISQEAARRSPGCVTSSIRRRCRWPSSGARQLNHAVHHAATAGDTKRITTHTLLHHPTIYPSALPARCSAGLRARSSHCRGRGAGRRPRI